MSFFVDYVIKIVTCAWAVAYFSGIMLILKKKEDFLMKLLQKALLKKVAKEALHTSRKEADSACLCFCFQPVMPKEVKELGKRK